MCGRRICIHDSDMNGKHTDTYLYTSMVVSGSGMGNCHAVTDGLYTEGSTLRARGLHLWISRCILPGNGLHEAFTINL